MMDCDPEHANVVMVFTPLYYIIYNYIYIYACVCRPKKDDLLPFCTNARGYIIVHIHPYTQEDTTFA